MSAADHDREARELYRMAASNRFRWLFGIEAVRVVMDEAREHAREASAMRAPSDGNSRR